ncbi:hypothetical protein, partial [Fodinibius roseus]|uniref:hypothetical protein n=1 Tax=Fodinibius roseus TaxID=1194090 RepID=UPI001B8B601D
VVVEQVSGQRTEQIQKIKSKNVIYPHNSRIQVIKNHSDSQLVVVETIRGEKVDFFGHNDFMIESTQSRR